MAFWYKIKLIVFIAFTCSSLFTIWIGNHLHSIEDFKKNFGGINDKIQCAPLIEGDSNEILRAKKYMIKHQNRMVPQQIIKMTKDCNSYKKNRSYILDSLTEEEKNFPIAYSIMMYKDIEQVERLLRAIYQPQNYYCIHVDKKTEAKIHEAMKSVASCFSNVFVLSNPVDVHWGGYSVLEPCIKCLQELSKYKNWKYFMNLSGQEFPIRTNYELVRILKVYNGTNDIESRVSLMRRFAYRVIWLWYDGVRTTKNNTQPSGIKLFKGEYHVVLARSFVKYVLKNNVARKFLKWIKTTGHPDETFFNTLNHNSKLVVPGAPSGKGHSYPNYSGLFIRYKIWNRPYDKRICYGKYHRDVCIMGAGDLQGITKSPALFVNKFHLDFEPLALDCMEEWYAAQTRKFYKEPWRFDASFYKYPPPK